MINIIRNIFKSIRISFILAMICISKVYAYEITAIDFNGDIIGQVISTGLVINSDGESIGSITADSIIVDDKGEIIGGVVPQGIAIGTDNRTIGTIHSDGVVRSMSGKDIGKSLPNGLVVDSQYNVIASVVFPGIVYSEDGTTIGRVTGAGRYANLDGADLGFISANGFAYKNLANTYSLDGRLLSTKIVVSDKGSFLGSISPAGKIVNSEGEVIGGIRANEYAYSDENEIIGKAVTSGYAFNFLGEYLGFITYNGAVVSGNATVGWYRTDGNIVDKDNNVIGFSVSIKATANDLQGRYLGRVLPKGLVVRAKEVIGHVGANRFVYNDENKIIGKINVTGPVFDTLGDLLGQSMPNGILVATGGNQIGYMKGEYAYDLNGYLVGGTTSNLMGIDNSNKNLGIVSFGSNVTTSYKVSPFGYMLNQDKNVSGGSLPLDAIYSIDGSLYSYMDPNGKLYNVADGVSLSTKGILYDKTGFMGRLFSPIYAQNYENENIGTITSNHLILGIKNNVIGKITPSNNVIGSTEKVNSDLTPIQGYSGTRTLAIGTFGNFIGYIDNFGKIIDVNNNIIGSSKANNLLVDNNNSIIGAEVPFVVVHNDKCEYIGVLNGKGQIINNRNIQTGKILNNGQVFTDVGSFLGYSTLETGLVDFEGHYTGSITNGVGFNEKFEAIGCVRPDGIVDDADGHWKYGVITPNPVIDFDGNIIGQVLINGTVVDNGGTITGYMQPNGNVVSKSQKSLGNVLKYRFAFDNNNKYLGFIDNKGKVIDSNNNEVGQVIFDGSIIKDGENIGYALYDFYIYNGDFRTIGYLTKDGAVLNLSGSKIGNISKGFIVDNNDVVIGRGNRDYIIRDDNQAPLGFLKMAGNVVNFNNENVGYLESNGSIKSAEGNEIAHAYMLQYYSPQKHEENKPNWSQPKVTYEEEQLEKNKVTKKTEVVNTKQPTKNKNFSAIMDPDGNYLGDVYEDGIVRDKDGREVGHVDDDGIVYDLENNPIATAEDKNLSANNLFIPAGAMGNGNPYGIGNMPSNLGPGGGHGQGERYDPAKQQYISKMQEARRQNMGVAIVKSKYSPSSFTGYEDDGWPNTSRTISSWRVNMSEMILKDKPIPAVIARSVYLNENLNNDNIPVTAIVERNVFAEDGRNIIIPVGSRIIGHSDSNEEVSVSSDGGAVRAYIIWDRIIRPDGAQFVLKNAVAADAQGRYGALGYYDEQLLKKYSTRIVQSALDGMLGTFWKSGSSTSTTGSSSTTTTDNEGFSDVRDRVLDTLDEVFDDIMKKKEQITSVTYVPAGTRIIIFPNEDLWLNSPERAKEAASQKNSYDNDARVLIDENKVDDNNNYKESGNSKTNATVEGEYDESVKEAQDNKLIDDTDDGNKRKKVKPTVPPTTVYQDDGVPDLGM